MYEKLADIQYVASSVGSVLANPSSTRTAVKAIILYNGNTTAETVELHNVPDSTGSLGTADASNRFFKQAIAADETYEIAFSYPIVLKDTNDAIFAKTTTGSKVTIMLLGDKRAV